MSAMARGQTTSHYVCGFMFSVELAWVGLIRKQRPAWQQGLLNGIGGRIEPREQPCEAMVREFKEETGCPTCAEDWHHFLYMDGENDAGTGLFSVDFFACRGRLVALRSVTDEKVEICRVRNMDPLWTRRCAVENVSWLVGLAIDHLRDGRPSFATVKYNR